MIRTLYTITVHNKLFDGAIDHECTPSNVNCWYKGDEYKKSLKLASEYSDNDVIKVCKSGISRDFYQWSAVEYLDDNVIGCEIKIFDPLERFERIKNLAKRAHLFYIELAKHTHLYKYDLIAYIAGKREVLGECMRGDHFITVYRYASIAFGDFTAYEKEGYLWLPEKFEDYGIDPNELVTEIDTGTKFWKISSKTSQETRLLYEIFQNN